VDFPERRMPWTTKGKSGEMEMGLLINERAMASRGDLSQKLQFLETMPSQISLSIFLRLRDFLKVSSSGRHFL
jgi:hypothetical protein